jgi:hypothetical protein
MSHSERDQLLPAIPRKQAFKVIVMKTTIEKRLHIKSLLQNVEIFKELKDHEFSKLADAMQEEAYEEGDVICRQGDVGSSFFIIKQGTATCIQADPHGNQQEVAQLTACFLCAFSTISSYILIRLVTILAKSRFSLANPARGRSRPRKKMAH